MTVCAKFNYSRPLKAIRVWFGRERERESDRERERVREIIGRTFNTMLSIHFYSIFVAHKSMLKQLATLDCFHTYVNILNKFH